MTKYKNSGGDSGVHSYESGTDRITVMFNDGVRYLYTYAKTGKDNVEHMKALAATGLGLNSFISKHIKKNYASKTR